MRPGWRVLADAAAVASAAAGIVRGASRAAIAARGRFRLGVPGGRTPAGLLRALASEPAASDVDWPRVEVLFADERGVAPGHPDRNDGAVRALLVPALGTRAPRLWPMAAESPDPEAAARDYEALLETPLDLLVLGVGEDGHVASLFPGSDLLAERRRRVAVVTDAPKPPKLRLTLTPRAIAEARHVLVLATGAGKADAVRLAGAGAGSVEATPARLVRDREWLVDAAAAGR